MTESSAPYSTPSPGPEKPVRVPDIRQAKGQRPIVMVTAYDATFARMFDEAGVDILLVGDSLGMVVQGRSDTLGVTLEHMLYHCQAVRRGTKRAQVVVDMPFLSYQVSPEEAVRNAGRLLAEGGAHAVKVEGGLAVREAIARMVAAGIPVMGHVGLMPQSVHAMGGFRVQGREPEEADRIVREAQAVADAGAYALVLEGIPGPLAETITRTVPIPTIGIGAGVACDGQVLVCYDLLGLTADLEPKFVKHYEGFFARGVAAARAYCDEVRARQFPTEAHTFAAKRP